jgi:septal ring factor EnvC (AmiA/AmiB activator)
MFNPAITSFITPIITTLVGVLLGWFLTKRKVAKETDLIEIQSIQKTIEIWKQLAEELRQEYQSLHGSFIEMKAENKRLETSLSNIKVQLNSFKTENAKLLQYIKEIKGQTNEKQV